MMKELPEGMLDPKNKYNRSLSRGVISGVNSGVNSGVKDNQH